MAGQGDAGAKPSTDSSPSTSGASSSSASPFQGPVRGPRVFYSSTLDATTRMLDYSLRRGRVGVFPSRRDQAPDGCGAGLRLYLLLVCILPCVDPQRCDGRCTEMERNSGRAPPGSWLHSALTGKLCTEEERVRLSEFSELSLSFSAFSHADPTVKYLVNALAQQGCPVTRSFFRVEDCSENASGGFLPGTGVRSANT